jgi:hypothetical protein
MKMYGRVDVYIHAFLISALVIGECWASRPGHFTAGERVPVTLWIGGWVGLSTGLNDVERRKILPYWNSNSDHSAVQPVASRYTDSAIPAQFIYYMVTIMTISSEQRRKIESAHTSSRLCTLGSWYSFINQIIRERMISWSLNTLLINESLILQAEWFTQNWKVGHKIHSAVVRNCVCS